MELRRSRRPFIDLTLIEEALGLGGEADVRLAFMRPGRPVENEYIEGFNGKFRDGCLNEHWFVTMDHARRAIEPD